MLDFWQSAPLLARCKRNRFTIVCRICEASKEREKLMKVEQMVKDNKEVLVFFYVLNLSLDQITSTNIFSSCAIKCGMFVSEETSSCSRYCRTNAMILNVFSTDENLPPPFFDANLRSYFSNLIKCKTSQGTLKSNSTWIKSD